MTSANGPEGPHDQQSQEHAMAPQCQSIECGLLESLVHHLIEKGVLTRNDALSVVQTVAQVKRSELEGGRLHAASVANELAFLERLYASFELMSDRPSTAQAFDGRNVIHLRPPLHGDNPEFPNED